MKLTILCYDKCSTCKKALNWLDEKGISYEKRPIKEQNPSKEELAVWHKKSGLPLKRFFNTSGNLYKELGLKDKLPQMTEEEQLELLASDGMLVKRPLAVTDQWAFPGFREKEWEDRSGRLSCKMIQGFKTISHFFPFCQQFIQNLSIGF